MAITFMKMGAASAQVAQKEAIAAEQRKEQQGKLFRFFLADKEEAPVTFVDGDLDPTEGILLPPRWYEHNLCLNGKWHNYFVCPEKTNPDAKDTCPIEESGDESSLVCAFTIIDHRKFASKDKTKTYQDQRRLFICKTGTFEILNKMAIKRGGLAGARVDISRVGSMSPAVGSIFDFIEKKPIEDLKSLYTREYMDPKLNKKFTVSNFIPADYESEIVYRTGNELRVLLGMGAPGAVAAAANTKVANPGGNEGPGGGLPDYSDKL